MEIVLNSPHPTGGWQEVRRQRVGELLAEYPGSFGPDQYHNPDNVAGYEPLALELVAQLGRVDVLVCSVGTGGHSAGVSRALREFFPHLRLVGVDTVGSTIFGQPARTRLMRGLGSSIHPRNIDYPAFDEVHWVAPGEAVCAARLFAAAQYAVVAGVWVRWLWSRVGWPAPRSRTRGSPRCSLIGPQRYFDTVFNDDYCHRHGLLTAHLPTEPDEITHPNEREVTRWTRCRRVLDPTAGQEGR